MIDLSKSINEIKKLSNSDTDFESSLVINVQKILNKPVKDLSNEDLRLLVNQNIFLDIIIPLCIERLQVNILLEGDYYEGDLLAGILRSDVNYWKNNKEYWLDIINIFNNNIELLKNRKVSDEIKNLWFDSYDNFLTIYKQ